MAGSGVVPEEYRRPGETPAEYLVPWCVMRSIPPIDHAVAPTSERGA
jgi:hypothetical protein